MNQICCTVKKNMLEIIGLVFLLTIVFLIFSLAGTLTDRLMEKIDQVRSLGDPKVIYPFSYIYFVALAFALASKPASKLHSYWLSLCSLASGGLFFFFSLLVAWRIYLFSGMTFRVFASLALLLIVPVTIDAVLRYLESKATRRADRIIGSLLIFSASFGLLANPTSIHG